MFSKILDALINPINAIFILAMFALVILDLKTKKDLKSQIVSLGVLGTFVGIFIGLLDFNPEDMKNSINDVLEGLKTAFLTSIFGMGFAISLIIYQRLYDTNLDDSNQVEDILNIISVKLDLLKHINNDNNTQQIIKELESIKFAQSQTRDETINISKNIIELKENQKSENKELIYILNSNFDKMNKSLEIAIDKLSKGATEEIIKALQKVIEEFNQELQIQFGQNFVKLNEAVINLITWQNNYKTYIEEYTHRTDIATQSIEVSKNSLIEISSKNQEILNVYASLEHMLNIYDRQIQELNNHLLTFANLSNNAQDMFVTIENSIKNTQFSFDDLSKNILSNNQKQLENFKDNTKNMVDDFKEKTVMIKNDFDIVINEFAKNQKEIDVITTHFAKMGKEVPNALRISLEELNRGLTSLTAKFKEDYERVMNNYKNGINK